MVPITSTEIYADDGTVIGTWSVTADGAMTYQFNEESNSYQGFTKAVDIIVTFDESQGNIELAQL